MLHRILHNDHFFVRKLLHINVCFILSNKRKERVWVVGGSENDLIWPLYDSLKQISGPYLDMHKSMWTSTFALVVSPGLPSSWAKPVRDWGVLLWPSVSCLESNGKHVWVWWASATVLACEPALPPSTETSVCQHTLKPLCVEWEHVWLWHHWVVNCTHSEWWCWKRLHQF